MRLPWAPVERLALSQTRPVIGSNGQETGHTERIAAVLGKSRRNIVRYRRQGDVDVFAADRLAQKLGLHPAEVWGDLWWKS